MKTQLKKIVYNGLDDRGLVHISASWEIRTERGEEQPDKEYVLLCKSLNESEIDDPPVLRAGEEGLVSTTLFCGLSIADKAGDGCLLGVEGRICAFAVCPQVGSRLVPEAISNTLVSYTGRAGEIHCSLKTTDEGHALLSVWAEQALHPEDFEISVQGEAYPLPFSVGTGKQSALFLSNLPQDAVKMTLRGRAKYRFVCKWED